MKDGLLKDTYQGRKLFKSEEEYFSSFISSIPQHEWSKWKVTVEEELVTTVDEYVIALEKLSLEGKTFIIIDKKNKLVQHMSEEVYKLNLDKRNQSCMYLIKTGQ